MSDKNPWDFHPDLTEDRLTEICSIFHEARTDAVDHHNYKMGDDAWVLGCRGYAWCKNRIIKHVQDETYDWLAINARGGRFSFTIGEVPVRFYKGDSKEPHERTMAQSHSEIHQLSLAFPDEVNSESIRWRFAIETDSLGDVIRIAFIGITGKKHFVCYWEYQNEEILTDIEPGLIEHPDTVEVDSPTVEIPTVDNELEKSQKK